MHIGAVSCLRLISVLCICLFLTGGHYGMLQCVAWAGMLWSYSEEDGLIQAAQDTFSGEKPCHLCVAIAESQRLEDKTPEPMQSKDLEKLKELQPLQTPGQLALKSRATIELVFALHVDPARLLGRGRARPLSPPPRPWS